MAHQNPYLQRRGDNLYFRIQVPSLLRTTVGRKEFTLALKTNSRKVATPKALHLGSIAKRMFYQLQKAPTSMSASEMIKMLREAKHALEISELKEAHQQEVFDVLAEKINAIRSEKLIARVEALEYAIRHHQSNLGAAHMTMQPSDVSSRPVVSEKSCDSYPGVFAVIDDFLDKYQKKKHPAMYKKHLPALNLLRTVLGNKPVNELRQSDLNEFFDIVGKLPPRWAMECKKRAVSARQLAKTDFPVTIAPKTFADNYVVPVRMLLQASIRNWGDQGFPVQLTTDGTIYEGERAEGESKQRAFSKEELERLLNGPELQKFRVDPKSDHMWWLPVIACFTGARVNEICQLNPQTDILEDSECKTPYFWITNETEGDKGIKKSAKNQSSKRKVPFHSCLIQLGLPDYLAGLKKQGAQRIFPAWVPVNKRASTQAEKWFRDFLIGIGLRDDTPFAKITGMHAFRHTLLTRATNSLPSINAGPLTGHSPAIGKSPSQSGYEGELSVKNKILLLEAINFGINLRALGSAGSEALRTAPPD